ncbi:MAG: hypothetical protein OXE59_10355 [Bacteroidetes bacterium]|nr:hypothetical protein [Bacteroidota bacterium]MCY4234122.1 hypothetical protein [Bacteroidota bacterium]
MPTAYRPHHRFYRSNQQSTPSVEATTLETLTVEKVLYEIQLIGNQDWILGQRKGHSWYSEDDIHLAEASQIMAIRIPARRN